jgi:hypothetical protein
VVNHTVVWAGVASRTHLVYGASWIRELARREDGEVAVEMMEGRMFFGDEALDPEVVASFLPDGVSVRPWTGQPAEPDGELWLLSVGAVGIKPWLRLRAKNPTRRFSVVVTDEGISTYGNWRSRREAHKRQGVREPWRTVRTSAVELATMTLATSRWPLHVQTDDGWALNKPAADEFRRLAPEPDRAERAVFISQPWPELGVMDESEYVHHVDDVARASRAAGLEFVVVPHPGEPEARFAHLSVTDGHTMAELNPVALGARVLAGASSTAMLNLAAIHGIPAVRVGTPQLADLDRRLAPRQATLLSRYATPSLSPEAFGRRLSQGFRR